MSRQFEFDPEKSLAITAYISQKTGATMYPILKMIYLADRLHLERYGRPITGDSYAAMQEGPTPSAIYDCMKFLRGDRQFSRCPNARDFLEVNPNTHSVTVRQMPDTEVLSDTDLECVDKILEWQEHFGSDYIIDQSHDQAWKATSRNKLMDIMTIAGTLKDGAVLTQHLAERFPDSN